MPHCRLLLRYVLRCALCLWLARACAADVVLCVTHSGRTLWTDRDCPAGYHRQAHATQNGFSATWGAEALDEQQQALQQYRQQDKRRPGRPADERLPKVWEVAAERAARCEQLTLDEEKIRSRMRTGYSGAEGERLRYRQRAIGAEKCRLGCLPC